MNFTHDDDTVDLDENLLSPQDGGTLGKEPLQDEEEPPRPAREWRAVPPTPEQKAQQRKDLLVGLLFWIVIAALGAYFLR